MEYDLSNALKEGVAVVCRTKEDADQFVQFVNDNIDRFHIPSKMSTSYWENNINSYEKPICYTVWPKNHTHIEIMRFGPLDYFIRNHYIILEAAELECEQEILEESNADISALLFS